MKHAIVAALVSLLATGCSRQSSSEDRGGAPPVPSPPSFPGASRNLIPKPSGGCVDGSGAPVTQRRRVGTFHGIELRGTGQVRLHQGPPRPLEIEAAPRVLERLATKVTGGQLVISLEGCVTNTGPIRIDAWSASPDLIRIAGSGEVRGEGPIAGQRMTVEISGSGDVNMSLDVVAVRAHIAGSGNIILRGRTTELALSIAGSGDFRSEQLRARRVTARIAGSGDASLDASDDLHATIIGSGDLRYRGNARISQQILGSGTVSKI